MKSRFVHIDGLRLHYLTWGDSGPPLVLSHATGFLAWTWAPVAERLADAGYQAYAYDARGHGDSDKPEATEENYDWHNFARDLRGFLGALGLRDVTFVGHSAGAAAGLYLAGTAPGYFSRIVAIEPIVMPGGFTPDMGRGQEMSEGARRRRSVFASPAEAFQHYRQRSLFERWPDEVLQLYVEHAFDQREDGSVELKCPPAVEATIFGNSFRMDTWDVLANTDVPALVVRSGETEPFLSMVAERVAERVPGGSLLTLDGLGHLAPMEDPARVAEEVLGWLRGEG